MKIDAHENKMENVLCESDNHIVGIFADFLSCSRLLSLLAAQKKACG